MRRVSRNTPAASTANPLAHTIRYPSFSTSRTPTAELTIIASIIGVRTWPAPVADDPITTRTNSGRNEIIPNIATPMAMEMTVDARSIGILNKRERDQWLGRLAAPR